MILDDIKKRPIQIQNLESKFGFWVFIIEGIHHSPCAYLVIVMWIYVILITVFIFYVCFLLQKGGGGNFKCQ